MDHGKVSEEELKRLEKRRKFKKYGLEGGVRHFGTWISSEKWQLNGKIDLLIEADGQYFPVDFKMTQGGVRENHRMQVAGYSLILEDMYGVPVEKGFIFLIPEEDVVPSPWRSTAQTSWAVHLSHSGGRRCACHHRQSIEGKMRGDAVEDQENGRGRTDTRSDPRPESMYGLRISELLRGYLVNLVISQTQRGFGQKICFPKNPFLVSKILQYFPLFMER